MMSIINFFAYVLPPIFFIVFGGFLITRSRQDMKKWCIWLAVTAFAGGLTVYRLSHSFEDAGLVDVFLVSTQAVFYILRMFAMEHEHEEYFTEISEYEMGSVLFHFLFWIFRMSSFFAVSTTLLVLFGRNLTEKLRMIYGRHKEIYIIKGNNQNALLLGNNIATHDDKLKQVDKNRFILFWLEEDDDEKMMDEKSERFGGIARTLDKENEVRICLKDIGLISPNNLFGKLLRKILFVKEKKYKVIFMPNDISVSDDVHRLVEIVRNNNKEPVNLEIFVITSSSWERDKLETISQMKNANGERKYPYTFHLVNEVDLITRQMIEKLPPYMCHGLILGGKATRDFTVMIIGFGEMGQAALLRLVMNGQFVGSNMRAIIIDEQIEVLKDKFLSRYPMLNKLCCSMEFHEYNVPGNNFLEFINDNSKIDYLVIALNDDEANKQTAIEIRLQYNRNKTILPHIAVITDRENRDSLAKENLENIYIFGGRDATFQESVIIRESLDKMAKAVHKEYGNKPLWGELELFLQDSNRAAADFIPTMLYLAGLSEKDVIDKEVLTDDKELIEILAQTEKLRWNAFHTAMGYIPMSIDEMYERFDSWDENSGIKQLKYACKDSKAKTHICLVTWDELDKINDAYRNLQNHLGEEPTHDFKKLDRNNVNHIPKFLREKQCTHQNQ